LTPLQVGRTNFETNAERQLVSNPDFTNPDKAYDVDGFIRSTVANSPKETRTTVKSQLDEWISPELRGNKATIQEILDDIGKNKPTIKENYMDTTNPNAPISRDVDSTVRHSQHMPNIPTTTPPRTAPEALQTIHPAKYTERSFSVHSPKHGKLFDDPGHTEVSGGAFLAPLSIQDAQNSANRIFTTRAGMYDIDGVKTYIPAEGQSGIYAMGTSKSKAAKDLGVEEGYKADDFAYLLHRGDDLKDFPPHHHRLQKLEEAGHTLDEWNNLIDEQQFDLDVSLDELKQMHDLPNDVDWGSVDPDIFQQAELITSDNAIEYGKKLSRMFVLKKGDIDPPLFKEWFPMHMKTSLNDAVEQGADVVRFPVNPESVAKQTGQPLNPGRAGSWADEFVTETDNANWTPSEEAQALGKIYKKRTNDGIKRIEAEYGIKLSPESVIDENGNEFLEIVLTPELKEAFQIVVYKDGGAVYKKPLMPLKY
jgi:hypothetical protein